MNPSFNACVFRKRTLKGVFMGFLAFAAGYSSVARTPSVTLVNLPATQPIEQRVQVNFSELTLGKKVHQSVDAELLVWSPGKESGITIRGALFGKASTSGRLSVILQKSLDQLPPFENCSMKGSLKKGHPQEVLDLVTGAIKEESDKVVQYYLTPLNTLEDFKRETLISGVSTSVRFTLLSEALSVVNWLGQKVHQAGKIKLIITGSLPERRSEELEADKVVEAIVSIK